MNFQIKIIALVLLVCVGIFSCNNQEEKKEIKKTTLILDNGFLVIDTFPNGNPRTTYKINENDTSRTSLEMYHQNGVMSMKGEAVQGERDGEWLVWDENKKLVTIGHYINGKEEGLKTVWYPNGSKRYEGIVSNDQRVGIWKFFKEDGSILTEKNYDLEDKK